MQDYIWDGEMDYGWEGLSAKVKSESEYSLNIRQFY